LFICPIFILGRKHRFNPPKTPSGDRPARSGYPTALEKLTEDLKHADPKCPVIFCLTGDFAEYGKTSEFGEAEVFIRGLSETLAFGSKRGLDCMFFSGRSSITASKISALSLPP